MNKITLTKRRQRSWLALSACLAASLAYAGLQPLGDGELADVNGQGVIAIDRFTNADYENASANMEFIKITQGLTIDINANIRRIRLGEYERRIDASQEYGSGCGGLFQGDCPVRPVAVPGGDCLGGLGDGTGACTADIDMEYMSLGTVDPDNGTFTTMTIVDPYIEFAVDTSNGTREVAGLRLGAAYQDGILAGRNNVLSGNVQVRAYPQGGVAAIINDELRVGREGPRFTALEGTATALGFIDIDVEAPLNSSPKLNVEGIRNFWISIQDQQVTYPDYGGLGGNTHSTAQPGFWLNLADNVTIRDMEPSDCTDPILGLICTDFGNSFPQNCWNGSQTQTRGDDAYHPFTQIAPSCR